MTPFRNAISAGSLLAVVGLATGCPTRDVSALDPRPAKVVKKLINVSSNRDVDILFVIDNSGSMKEEQESLATNFPLFINVLNNIQGGLPNIHLGVVSSNMGIGGYSSPGCTGPGDNGILQNTPRGACSGPTDRYIKDVANPDGTRSTNYSGNLADAFTCIAKLGTAGCGLERHMASMEAALKNTTENAGFLRHDAYLGVIIIGDEDDCSARDTTVFDPSPAQDTLTSTLGPFGSFRCTEFGIECDMMDIARTNADYMSCEPRGDSYLWHTQHYVDFLNSLKDDPRHQIVVATIAGNASPVGVAVNSQTGEPELKESCSSANGLAYPGVRMDYLRQQFGVNGDFESICNGNLSDAMNRIAQLLAAVVGNPCIEGNIDPTDISPSEPGLQLECQLSDVRDPDTDNEQQTVIPRCPMTSDTTPDTSQTPCWWAELNPTDFDCSIYPSHVALHVERNGVDAPPGTFVSASCVGL